MSHPGIEPEKNDGKGIRVAMDLDQLKQYFDAQLHDVKAQLSHMEKNISQKFNDLTNILCIVNNLDKGLAIADNMQQNDVLKVDPPLEKDSALHKIQPSTVVAQKPVLDDKALKESARSAVNEYITSKDMKVVESTLDANFATKDSVMKFVDFFIEYFLVKPIKRQKTMAPILVNMIDSKYNDLTPQIIANRFSTFPLRMNIKPGEIINSITATKFWDHMALLMGFMLTSERFNFDHVWHSCKSILYTQGGDRVLSSVFLGIHSLKGRLWSVNKWSRSKVELEDFTMSADFVGKNNLGYLNKKEEEEASARNQLMSILRNHPHDALGPVQDWIKESWGSNPHSPILVRSLMSAICEVIGAGDGNNYQYRYANYTRQLDLAVLNNHAKLLRFIINKDTTLEYICLKEVCISLEGRQNQYRVLALNIFSHLLKLDIISVKGFKEFHSREQYSYPQLMKMNFFWECVLHSRDVKALFT